MLNITNRNENTYHATRAEAEKLIKSAKAGSQFNLSVRVDLQIADDPDHIYPDGGASYMPLSKKEALRLVNSLLSETMEKEKNARLRIRTYERESYSSKQGTRMVTIYWIG
jgi:hypothetical protein